MSLIVCTLLSGFISGGVVAGVAERIARRRAAPTPVVVPENPAVAALTAALADRPDPRAPRDPAREPDESRIRVPKLPVGI